MLKKIILIIIFAALSAFASLRYLDHASKSNPIVEIAVGKSLSKLYEHNDQLNEQVGELSPIGEADYDQVSDGLYRLSEEFSSLRFETMIEAVDAYPPLETSLDGLDNHISERTSLADQYAQAQTPEQQSELIEQLSALDGAAALEEIESQFESYSQALTDNLKQSRLYAMIALGGLGLSLLWLFFSALANERKLKTSNASFEKKLAQKQEELNIAESLFSKQKKLSTLSSDLNTELQSAFDDMDTARLNIDRINQSLGGENQLHQKLALLSDEISKEDRDKKRITALMIEAITAYKETDTSIAQESASQLESNLRELKANLSRVIEAHQSRAVIEEI